MNGKGQSGHFPPERGPPAQFGRQLTETDIERRECEAALALLERCRNGQLPQSVYEQLHRALLNDLRELPQQPGAQPKLPVAGATSVQSKVVALSLPQKEPAEPIATPTDTAVRAPAPSVPRLAPSKAAPARPTATRRALRIGDTLAERYVLVEAIGTTPLTCVFKAIDCCREVLPLAERYVAIKCLHDHLQGDPTAVAELQNEYHQLLVLSHPNIPRVFDFEQSATRCFLVLEHVAGESVARLVERLAPHRLRHGSALALLREVGAALVHANERGVRHGNLTAEKVVLTDGGQVRVLDIAHAPTWWHRPTVAAKPDIPDDDLCGLARVAYQLLSDQQWRNERIGAEPAVIRHLSSTQWRCLQRALLPTPDQPNRAVRAWLAELRLDEADLQLPTPANLSVEQSAQAFAKPSPAVWLMLLCAAAVVVWRFAAS
jgi:serine/threonine protein kinase